VFAGCSGEPPPRKAITAAGQGKADDALTRKTITADFSASNRRRALIAAGRAFRSSLTHLRIGLDHLAAIGIGLDYDPAGELEGILADLRLIVAGRASIADLRPEVPDYMVRAAIAYRQQRARQSGGRLAA
jgi:hypothetical protein